jgi:hypothetical protein
VTVLDEMLQSLEASQPPEVPLTEAHRQWFANLTSCDFVGDSGCCDPDCWQCHSPIGPENLRTLAKNLAAAGQLCRAWQMRVEDPAWSPGCNLEPPKSKESA